MEQAGLGMAERVINHEIRERFGGTVKRAVLRRSDDEPGQLVVRVFVEAADDEGLAGWQRAHQAGIEEFRRELSLRRPWSWWPGPTRSSSTCGTTEAGRRRAWSSGAA